MILGSPPVSVFCDPFVMTILVSHFLNVGASQLPILCLLPVTFNIFQIPISRPDCTTTPDPNSQPCIMHMHTMSISSSMSSRMKFFCSRKLGFILHCQSQLVIVYWGIIFSSLLPCSLTHPRLSILLCKYLSIPAVPSGFRYSPPRIFLMTFQPTPPTHPPHCAAKVSFLRKSDCTLPKTASWCSSCVFRIKGNSSI